MIYGLLAEFETEDGVVAAAQTVRRHGYRKLDAYSPHPIAALDEALAIRPTLLGWLMLAAAVFGGLFGFGMQYYACVYAYPLNVGGRPLNSWPSFIPITFELTVLFGSVVAALALFARNGLPRPHHPLFEVENFRRATSDRYFLCVHHSDPIFDIQTTHALLGELHAMQIYEVPG